MVITNSSKPSTSMYCPPKPKTLPRGCGGQSLWQVALGKSRADEVYIQDLEERSWARPPQ